MDDWKLLDRWRYYTVRNAVHNQVDNPPGYSPGYLVVQVALVYKKRRRLFYQHVLIQ